MHQPSITEEQRQEWEKGMILVCYAVTQYHHLGGIVQQCTGATLEEAQRNFDEWLQSSPHLHELKQLSSLRSASALYKDTYGFRAFGSGKAARKARLALRNGTVRPDQEVTSDTPPRQFVKRI